MVFSDLVQKKEAEIVVTFAFPYRFILYFKNDLSHLPPHVITDFPKIQNGEGFQLSIQCGVASLDLLLESEVIYSFSDLHDLYGNLVMTAVSTTQSRKEAAYLTDFYSRFCKHIGFD